MGVNSERIEPGVPNAQTSEKSVAEQPSRRFEMRAVTNTDGTVHFEAALEKGGTVKVEPRPLAEKSSLTTHAPEIEEQEATYLEAIAMNGESEGIEALLREGVSRTEAETMWHERLTTALGNLSESAHSVTEVNKDTELSADHYYITDEATADRIRVLEDGLTHERGTQKGDVYTFGDKRVAFLVGKANENT